ncbi:hypothetical protein T10_6963 [Trichinella papuae]|uniref:Uncharacterized protein n=1 Tax=Trichinella papuae TaxID=268474 RepID=A0A0V1MA36_9BILA|nr:hypothetical protein T10_6963 [Trichinella papuae]
MKTIKSHCFKMHKANCFENFSRGHLVVTNLISIYHYSILECHQWNEVLEVVASASKSLGANSCQVNGLSAKWLEKQLAVLQLIFTRSALKLSSHSRRMVASGGYR